MGEDVSNLTFTRQNGGSYVAIGDLVGDIPDDINGAITSRDSTATSTPWMWYYPPCTSDSASCRPPAQRNPMPTKLLQTIHEDCQEWGKLVNKGDRMFEEYMYVQVCSDSDESGLYQLVLNGYELWYGTLDEINAIVKSMLARLTHPERYEVN